MTLLVPSKCYHVVFGDGLGYVFEHVGENNGKAEIRVPPKGGSVQTLNDAADTHGGIHILVEVPHP